eukprot:11557279-Alexandrium_andersonii.AAC.1
MSASLVGSEMCIRDRPLRPSDSGSARTPAQDAPLGSLGDQFRGRARASACLLYTSDAADDM